MTEQEIEINEKMEEELDYQFPKGDKSRGKALVLFAVAQMEIAKVEEKLNDLQEAYNIAMKEIVKLRRKLYGRNA